jgi:hypothetical protein
MAGRVPGPVDRGGGRRDQAVGFGGQQDALFDPGGTLLFLLAPASRVGYLIYPLGLSVWLLLTRPSRTRPADQTSHGRNLTPTARVPGHGPTPMALPGHSAPNGVARPAYSATSRG